MLTAVFLRGESNGHITVQLVQAKSRVSVLPVKKMTIPRLELMAATIGVGLTDNVLKSIEFESVQNGIGQILPIFLSWIQRIDNWGIFGWN